MADNGSGIMATNPPSNGTGEQRVPSSVMTAPHIQFGTVKNLTETPPQVSVNTPTARAPGGKVDQNGKADGATWGRGGKVKGTGERVISIKRLWEEVDAKRARALISGSSFRYLIFVVVYLIALHHQKSAEGQYSQHQAFKDLFVDNAYRHPETGLAATFKDIKSVSDLWAWMDNRFIPTYYDLFWTDQTPKQDIYKMAIADRNRITNGFRWVQRRAKQNECLTTSKYNAFFPFCHPKLSGDARLGEAQKEAFGPFYDASKYVYTDYDFTNGGVDSGFVQYFPFDRTATLNALSELRLDRWIDPAIQGTQWWRMDFATYNPSSNLFTQVEFVCHFDPTGQVIPEFKITSMRSEVYMNSVRDYIQIVLELLVMVGIVMYIIGDAKDAFMNRAIVGSWSGYFGNFWSMVDLLQIILFVIDFIVWIVIITDPVRKNIVVELGPADGESRAFLQDKLHAHGYTISLDRTKFQMQSYFAIQALTLLVSLLRFLKYLTVNPFLGALVETFVIMKGYLIQFICIVVASNIAFAYMGYILFGEYMKEFHSFDQSYFTLWGTLMGDGVRYAQLSEANPVGAPIFYVPFAMFYAFVVLQLVVAIVVEAHQVQQAHRASQVGLMHQMMFGLMRWIPMFRRYAGSDQQWRYDGPDTYKIREWLRDWNWDEVEYGDDEYTESELFEKMKDKNVRWEDVNFIFHRYKYCTRPRDPPAPEPEVNDMVRELFKQIKVLSDAHAVAQRKLDTILAGQTM